MSKENGRKRLGFLFVRPVADGLKETADLP